jgi:FdhD protein
MNTVMVPTLKYLDGKKDSVEDLVVVEEPLEIFVDGEPFRVTMRLPGEEIPLAVGLCFTEEIIESVDDLDGASYCGETQGNRIDIYLTASRKKVVGEIGQRGVVTYSSCGICGTDMVRGIVGSTGRIAKNLTMEIENLSRLRQVFEGKQELFGRTGGAHGAAIFDVAGSILAFSEDVGRHNALDKAIGKVVLERKTEIAGVIILSSRLSYEMVQKAARLGVGILAGTSSATSLAVELAEAANLTLVGFFREGRANVYTHPERLIFP